jgi:putative DNA primase/helicase
MQTKKKAASKALDELTATAVATGAVVPTPAAVGGASDNAYEHARKWCRSAIHSGCRWDADARAWHVRDGVGIWGLDRVNHVNGAILYAAQASNPRDTGAWARYFQKVAETVKGLVTTSDQWDSGLLEVGTPGGVLDLCTGNVLEDGAGRLVTKRLVALPAGTSPSWLKFLNEATKGDLDMMDYLQRWAGYTLSGSTQEHAILFIHGPGGNGKSVFIDTIRHALGDYARTLPMDALMESRNDRHPAEIAMLRGVRLAVANETQEGRRWDEAKVKQLSGGDAIAARFMAKDWFQFRPTHKLVVVGNHAPTIGTIDDALRRRLHMVPFVYKPEAIDPTLGERLRSEVAGVLAWMLEGFKQWQANGLSPPASVIDATNAYFAEQDMVGAWLAECCEVPSMGSTTSKVLYQSWSHWCEQNGIIPKSMKRLSPELEQRGLTRVRTNQERGFRGIVVTHV